MSGRVVIAGVSTRAAAESAARAGFEVTAIDAFGDLDQHPRVDARSLPGAFTAHSAAEAVADVACDGVTYLAPFENHSDAVRTLAAKRALWGNSPDALTRLRDPMAVADALRRRGLAAPNVRLTPDAAGDWVIKPLASGGGHRIRRWRTGDAVPSGSYVQEFVEGTAGSVAFLAAGGRAVPLGIFHQLIGDSAFGASAFQYCGNILDPLVDEALADRTTSLVQAVSESFQIVGVNGMDFVARAGVPYPVEINPRWCASMELLERAYGCSVFGMHAAACATGTLPDFDAAHARRTARGAFGKAIVFARRDATAGDTRAWIGGAYIDGAEIRDVPHPGTRVLARRPICTVFAEAHDAAACYSTLVERAIRVYADLRTPG